MTALPDPRTLSMQQRRALRLIAAQRLYRQNRRWGFPASGVSLDVAGSLCGLKLAKVDYAGRAPALVLTGAGRDVLGVMEARAERRKSA